MLRKRLIQRGRIPMRFSRRKMRHVERRDGAVQLCIPILLTKPTHKAA
jgi:hypothetical protein